MLMGYGSQYVNAGEIILKQRGTKILPGNNVSRASDDSLFARISGIVTFEWAKKGKQQVSVYAQTSEVKPVAKKEVKTAPKAAKTTTTKPAAKTATKTTATKKTSTKAK